MEHFVRHITSTNIAQYSNLFHYLNLEKICNNSITKDPTAPQVCRYTLPFEMSESQKQQLRARRLL